MILAFAPVAAARAFLAGDDSWLVGGRNAIFVWTGVWAAIILARRFREGQRRGGVAEGIREALGGPGIGWRFAVAAGLVLALVLHRQYLRGTPWDAPFSIVFIVVCLSGIAWQVFKGSSESPLEGRASGTFLKVSLLLLVGALAFFLLISVGAIPGLSR